MTGTTRRAAASGLAALAVSAAQASAQAVPAGSWRVREIGGETIEQAAAPTLDIAADGAVAGQGGCNRYRGSATLGDGTVAFSPLAATRMACPEPAMAIEHRFFEALAAARRFRAQQGGLLLLDGNDLVLMRLERGG